MSSSSVVRGLIAICVYSSAAWAHSSDVIVTVGGNGSPGFSGDAGPAVAAALKNPGGIALDQSGNVLIADRDNHRVRRIDSATGTITTVAGTGAPAFSGDGAAATAAALNAPSGVAVVGADIYIADTANQRIRKIAGATGNISTVAGNGTAAFAGDNQLATLASLNAPQGVSVDSAGNVYIADTLNQRVRRIDGLTGLISTAAGTGTAGAGGDGAAATAAQLNAPSGVISDNGILYIADTVNHRVRRVDAQGKISTFAGNGTAVLAGDGGPAANASLNAPGGIALDAAKNLLIADSGNQRIRKVDAVTNTISTIAGTGPGFSGDGGDPLQAALNSPAAVALDASNSVYIADKSNQRIRKIAASTAANIAIVSITATPNPVRTTEAAAFTVAATQAQGKPLTFSWNFGDGSPPATGQTVNHAYAAEGSFTVTVTATDNVQSVSSALNIMALGPNSGADGTANVSTGKTVTNPIDGTAISIPGSNGGVLDFSAMSPAVTASGRAATQIKFFIDDGATITPLSGSAVVHKFEQTGIFITNTQVLDSATNTLVGRMRKTIAISDRELGVSKLMKPGANDISGVGLKGKFVLNGGLASDNLTFTGKFELPGGLDISQPLPVSVSIGNVIDSLTVSARGSGSAGVNGIVSGLKIKYPSVGKKNPILPPQQVATISWKVSGSGLTKRGFDTEGVDPANVAAQTKAGAPLKIQVLLNVAGETYEQLVPVVLVISKDNRFGVIQGRH